MTSVYLSRKKIMRTTSVSPIIDRDLFCEDPSLNTVSDEDYDKSSASDHRILVRKQLPSPLNYKDQKKSSLGDFLHSLFSSKKQHDLTRFSSKKNLHMSCPNLNNRYAFDEPLQFHQNEIDEGKNNKRSSSAKCSMSRRIKSPDSCSGDTLKVPDMFVTSLTRSHSDDTYQSAISFNPRKENKNSSTSCLYHTTTSKRLFHTNNQSKSVGCSNNIAQITPYLYVGRVEAANDQRLLCKLDIHSLVDITNVNINQHINLLCPCTCQKRSNHSHPKLYVNADSTDHNRIQEHFPMINKFINGSKELGRATLIYSEHSRVRAPVAAIQYLITCQGMGRQEAYDMVKSRWPDTLIDQTFQKMFSNLKRIQLELAKDWSNAQVLRRNVSSPGSKSKSAWAAEST
ncbi:uncharacterized protein LOC106872706 [Argonauta hians]